MSRTKRYVEEHKLFRRALLNNDNRLVLYHLGRVHILSQDSLLRHMTTHFIMFLYASVNFDLKEIFGQMIRLTLTIPAHLAKRVPKGNTGWSTVGITEVMPVPSDLRYVISDKNRF